MATGIQSYEDIYIVEWPNVLLLVESRTLWETKVDLDYLTNGSLRSVKRKLSIVGMLRGY